MLRDYWELTKPRVIALMLLTAWIGMLLASPPGNFPLHAIFWGTLGIALSAGSAAVINQLVERHIDIHMRRTQERPVASGRVSPSAAGLFALLLGITGLGSLILFVNSLTAWLTFFSLIGYALVYTLFLKRTTPQNIVIGGAAGAAPPLLGWTAVTGTLDPFGLLLVLIIFTWTPPHFWALAIYRQEEYAKTNLPMLPVTHGARFTKYSILLYIILLILSTLLPYITHMSGITYLICALGLGAGFLYYGIALLLSDDPKIALRTFAYSIVYLMGLFLGLLFDHYLHFLIL
jgi:protoheme IX farnesyltransferase